VQDVVAITSISGEHSETGVVKAVIATRRARRSQAGIVVLADALRMAYAEGSFVAVGNLSVAQPSAPPTTVVPTVPTALATPTLPAATTQGVLLQGSQGADGKSDESSSSLLETSANAAASDKRLSAGAVLGIVLACLVGIAGVFVVARMKSRRHRNTGHNVASDSTRRASYTNEASYNTAAKAPPSLASLRRMLSPPTSADPRASRASFSYGKGVEKTNPAFENAISEWTDVQAVLTLATDTQAARVTSVRRPISAATSSSASRTASPLSGAASVQRVISPGAADPDTNNARSSVRAAVTAWSSGAADSTTAAAQQQQQQQQQRRRSSPTAVVDIEEPVKMVLAQNLAASGGGRRLSIGSDSSTDGRRFSIGSTLPRRASATSMV
jgi:hypothetical protein